MEDMRQLVRAGITKEDFVDGMSAALDGVPEALVLRAAHGYMEELQLLAPAELNNPQKRKIATTKNQRKRQRKAQRNGRRQRA